MLCMLRWGMNWRRHKGLLPCYATHAPSPSVASWRQLPPPAAHAAAQPAVAQACGTHPAVPNRPTSCLAGLCAYQQSFCCPPSAAVCYALLADLALNFLRSLISKQVRPAAWEVL